MNANSTRPQSNLVTYKYIIIQHTRLREILSRFAFNRTSSESKQRVESRVDEVLSAFKQHPRNSLSLPSQLTVLSLTRCGRTSSTKHRPQNKSDLLVYGPKPRAKNNRGGDGIGDEGEMSRN